MGNSFKIEILSPVHIGSGNTLKPMDIGECERHGERYIYIFDFDKVIEKIPEHSIDKFSELIINFGDKNKNKYKNMGHMLLEAFGIGYEQWEDISLYKVKKKDVGSIHDIYEAIKYGDKVYIPGSSIKGAIRTAIVYCFLKEKGYIFRLGMEKVQDKRNRNNYRKVNCLYMIKPDGKEIKGIKNNNPDVSVIEDEIRKDMFAFDPTKDVFRCLQVSDSKELKADEILEIRKVYVANTTSFERIGGKVRMVECIKVGEKFIDISIVVNDKVINYLSKIYKDNRFYEVVEFIKSWDICVKRFSQDLINTELRFWEEQKSSIEKNIEYVYQRFDDISREFNIESVIRGLKDVKHTIEDGKTVIRLGKFSGYFSHSIGILLAERDKPYNLGKLGKMLSKTAHDDLFPLTRRLTLDNQTLGWCRLIESDEESEESENTAGSEMKHEQGMSGKDIKDVFKSKGWRVK